MFKVRPEKSMTVFYELEQIFRNNSRRLTNLWQSMHRVVIQAGQDKIASLEGTFPTSGLVVFGFFLAAVDVL